MAKVLTREQIDQYRQQGFVSPIDVLSEDEALGYASRLQETEREFPQELNAQNRNNPHLIFRFLDELVHHPVILDAVEDLIGENFSLWGSVLFIKEPRSPHYVSWHQDATYMGITPHNFVTPWLALSESNLQTGCMSMIPGSHLDSIQAHEDTFGEDNILTRGQKINSVDEAQAVHLFLKAGQMSLHHARVIHGSQPNRSADQRRVGFAMQAYMPAGARQTIGDNYWMPIRGDCGQPDFVYLDRPHEDMGEQELSEREKVNRNWAEILYQDASTKRAY
jgi:ectoine hydroxylase-related dioxygenase (phytanoyl-CoA dioxygenase family)